jgi:hypothetical protein
MVIMRLILIAFTGIALFTGACKKKNDSDPGILYGTWVKGINAGDTLVFINKNGKKILAYNPSFNATQPTYTETGFDYQNGKLYLAPFSGSTALSEINSFTWKQYGKEFEVQGIQLFSFLSSTQVMFNYKKIN